MIRPIALILPVLSFFLRSSTQGLPTDDCPILGPSFPSNFDPSSSTAIRELQSLFPEQIESLFSSGVINRTHVSFSIDVFSTATNSSIYSYHHAAPGLNGTLTAGVLNDGTIYRIGSVSKLYTVYAILAIAGMEVLDHPVTRYLPELAGNSRSDPLERIIWDDVTVGALASHLGGTGGFPYEATSCEIDPVTKCLSSVQEFLTFMRDRKRPVVPPFETPLYSDVGFGVLGRVLERLTGLPYADAVQSLLCAPLGLNGTSAIEPPSEGLNGLILSGSFAESSWGFDNQLTAPSGGLYSNNADMRTTGLSILHSELLPPPSTRAWLKPRSHTASLTNSVGAPWEISRLTLPVSPGSPRTRVSDLYMKVGGQAGYGAVFALSPDHGLGYSVLVAGPSALALEARFTLRDLVGENFLTAAEHAAAENAARNFAGRFVDASVEGTNLTLTVDVDRPGLGLESWFVGGVEWRANLTSPASTLPAANLTVRLYPTGLVSPSMNASVGATQLSFRAIPQVLPRGARAAVEGGQGLFNNGCETWYSVDFWSFDGIGSDEFVFEVVEGRLEGVRSLVAGTWMRRVG